MPHFMRVAGSWVMSLPVVDIAAAPHTPTTAEPAEFEDTELANSIFSYELAILRQWKDALDSFHVVIKSETQKSAKADFASALLKVFTEKVLGGFVKDMK